MADLMRKTKKELVRIIGEMNADHDVCQNECAALKESDRKLRKRLENAVHAKAAAEQNLLETTRERDSALSALAAVKAELKAIMTHNESLSETIADLERRLAACRSHADDHFELFKSFVDDHSKSILLIDSRYSVAYVNQRARDVLALSESNGMLGSRIFDFMTYTEAIRLKEKLDSSFVTGETEKIKEIKFRSPGGELLKLSAKLSRVRFKDQPSIKMVFK